MKLKQINPVLVLNHDEVCKKFNGTKYLGEIQIRNPNGEWSTGPAQVYYAATPDRSLGHQSHFYLFEHNGRLYINGLKDEEIDELREMVGVHCSKCGDVVYSRYRHDFQPCSCGACFVDGGKDYLRAGGEYAKMVNIDIFSGEITEVV